MEEFCKELPKIELHAHLNGSLSKQTLKNLGCLDENVEEYQRLNNIFEKSDRTLDECFELFKVAHKATSTPLSVYKACTSVIKDFAEDNVVYLELRTTPRSEDGMTKEEYVEAVIKAIKESKSNVLVKLLLSIDRRHDRETSEGTLKLIIEMFKKYPDIITGIDLSGNPNVGFFNQDLFQKARDAGLKVSLHCGEVKNVEEVYEMLKFTPDRIGHATCLHYSYGGNNDTWDLYCRYQIPAEFCLTSNVVCGTSKSYQEHHIREWIDKKLPYSLGTDDKGVFSTSLSQEFFLAAVTFNLSKLDLWNIAYNSIQHSFASEYEKKHLQQLLNAWKINVE